MEGWVKKVAELSGQSVDWHFVGGRAVVKALGDLGKVAEAIEALRPEHDRLYLEETKEYFEKWGGTNIPPSGRV